MKKGFSLAEVIVAVSIMGAFLTALVSAHNLFLRSAHGGPEKAKALFLAAEGIENMRFARDESWSTNIEPFTALSPETIDGMYTRETALTAIGNGSREVDVTVSWPNRDTTASVSLSAIITNLYDN